MRPATDGSLRIVVRPDVLAAARAGDREALRTLLHEAGHVVLHGDDLLEGRAPAGEAEEQADRFADFVLWLVGGAS